MTKTLIAAVFATLLMLLTACGGGSDSQSSSSSSSSSAAPSDDDATAAKAIADSMMASQKSGDSTSQLLSLSRKDADCIGTGMVDKVGTDQLQKYGMLTKDLKAGTDVSGLKMTKADAEATAGTVFSCTDVEKMMNTAINKSGSIPKSAQACIAKALNEDALRPIFTLIFQGKSTAAQRQLTSPLLACSQKAQQ